MKPKQAKDLEYALHRYRHKFVNCTNYHTIRLSILWPIFNRARLKRFNDLWDSGLEFNDCWRISKAK
jgi:hypothetical protein